MTGFLDLRERTEVPLLIAFADLTRFHRITQTLADADVADAMDAYYGLVTTRVEAAEGHVVKFIGDAALIVFSELSVDRGVHALLGLKVEVDGWFAARRWPCRLLIKVHFGPVIAGPYGPPDHRRFDVLGKAVNAAARLHSSGVALSPQAFRKLGKNLRERFKKHTPPITYIRTADSHSDQG